MRKSMDVLLFVLFLARLVKEVDCACLTLRLAILNFGYFFGASPYI
jgi:hypothetical protein